MADSNEDFAIPLAPDEPDQHRTVGGSGGSTSATHSANEQPLTNADFRKLLMTPRGGTSSLASGSHGDATPQSAKRTGPGFTHRGAHVDIGKAPDDKEAAKKAQQKKKTYVHQKDEDEDSLNMIMKKYRDRAKERRDGSETIISSRPDAPSTAGPSNAKATPAEVDSIQATSGYHAVAPDLKSNLNAQERRKQMIQESKYLGGDMEHTHLVKGLDYALLQKVRSEISSKQREEDELETAYAIRQKEHDAVENDFKTKIGKGIYRVLFREEAPKMNDLFAPRRMAYVIDLDEDFAESDIPTTLVRSKADCPVVDTTTTLTTNDMVIQKLTQVLSYLRTDNKKKRKGKDKDLLKELEKNIYDDIGDYVPSMKRPGEIKKEVPNESYFERPSDEPERDHRRDSRQARDSDRRRRSDREDEKARNVKRAVDSRLAAGFSPADLSLAKQQEAGINPAALSKEDKDKGMASVFKRDHAKGPGTEPGSSTSTETDRGIRMSAKGQADSYMECYPDEYEMYTAIGGDSDDEADFSKMDLGNKKGPIRRWDFDNPDEYEAYMSNREALPKAAFQYGVKMNDGRKTRKVGGPKTEQQEKQKLDKEWDQISRLISKRKSQGGGGREEVSTKRSKY